MPYKIQPKGGKFCVVNTENGKTVNCHDDKPKALRQMRAIMANEKADLAAEDQPFAGAYVECYEESCERAFMSPDGFDVSWKAMVEHAEAVHTFNDIERLVSETVREKYGRAGDYSKKPPVAATWVWVNDMASDWVVFSVEKGSDHKLMKASYSITDGKVTLGDAVEVKRRTVYDEVKSS